MSALKGLWGSNSLDDWQESLQSYDAVIAQQGVERLPELDCWYREDLPGLVSARKPAHVTHAELVRITEWKMSRGIWRARNLALVRSNPPEKVVELSTRALAAVPHTTAPIAALAELAGVGPATASAVLAAASPSAYPFLDELVSAQIPKLEKVEYTLGYYARYASALRARAGQLGGNWTPAFVERALWANAGGKAGLRSN